MADHGPRRRTPKPRPSPKGSRATGTTKSAKGRTTAVRAKRKR